MKLSDLEPRLYKWTGGKSLREVADLAAADSVLFLCPACFEKNDGPVGTHGIRIDFVGRKMPDDLCIHNSEGKPVRWNMRGTELADITLSPSILLIGGCEWHGFVENGGIRTV